MWNQGFNPHAGEEGSGQLPELEETKSPAISDEREEAFSIQRLRIKV
jgi:4-hydroxy-L-threonine phosphate dehydrogenase PdxA